MKIYSSEIIIEMNATETKTTEEINTDLIIDIEESKEDTTETPNQTTTIKIYNGSGEVRNILVKVLTSISRRKSSTEIVIVPETQDNDRMDSFLVNSPSQ